MTTLSSSTHSDSLSILAALCKLKFGGPRPLRIWINADLYYDPHDGMRIDNFEQKNQSLYGSYSFPENAH